VTVVVKLPAASEMAGFGLKVKISGKLIYLLYIGYTYIKHLGSIKDE
jgi:hypothetical protein